MLATKKVTCLLNMQGLSFLPPFNLLQVQGRGCHPMYQFNYAGLWNTEVVSSVRADSKGMGVAGCREPSSL